MNDARASHIAFLATGPISTDSPSTATRRKFSIVKSSRGSTTTVIGGTSDRTTGALETSVLSGPPGSGPPRPQERTGRQPAAPVGACQSSQRPQRAGPRPVRPPGPVGFAASPPRLALYRARQKHLVRSRKLAKPERPDRHLETKAGRRPGSRAHGRAGKDATVSRRRADDVSRDGEDVRPSPTRGPHRRCRGGEAARLGPSPRSLAALQQDAAIVPLVAAESAGEDGRHQRPPEPPHAGECLGRRRDTTPRYGGPARCRVARAPAGVEDRATERALDSPPRRGGPRVSTRRGRRHFPRAWRDAIRDRRDGRRGRASSRTPRRRRRACRKRRDRGRTQTVAYIRVEPRRESSSAPIAQQRPRLVEALLELPGRVRVGNDSAADPEPHLPARHLERPDGDVQLESRQRARDPDGSGVHLACGRLERGDELHRPHLRRPGDRTGWECRP